MIRVLTGLLTTSRATCGRKMSATAQAFVVVSSAVRIVGSCLTTPSRSNLAEVLGVTVGEHPTDVPGVAGLAVMNVDPEAEAAAYRDRTADAGKRVLLVSTESAAKAPHDDLLLTSSICLCRDRRSC